MESRAVSTGAMRSDEMMERITILLSILAMLFAVLGGFRWLVNEWRLWRKARRFLVLLLSLLLWASPAIASLSDVYIGLASAGSDTGANCTNRHAGSFFNTSGNWGSGSTQIGSDTIVHVCGTWTGGTNTKFLQFQASGTAGHPVTLLFETGAVMQPTYCSDVGCIDLNGRSHLVISGGSACGKLALSTGATTACNGQIQNYFAGMSGATCPGGACTETLSGSTRSSLIGTCGGCGFPDDVEVKNIKLGPRQETSKPAFVKTFEYSFACRISTIATRPAGRSTRAIS